MVDAGDDVFLEVMDIFLQRVEVHSQGRLQLLNLGIREGALKRGLNIGCALRECLLYGLRNLGRRNRQEGEYGGGC